jgi:FkbM family methyltransferase
MLQGLWIRVLNFRDKILRLPQDTSQSLEASKLWPILQKSPCPYVVDIGANDGYHISNSYFFIKQGWNALLVEPVSASFRRAKELHASNSKVQVANFAISNKNGNIRIYLQHTHDNNYFATVEESNHFRENYVDYEKFEDVKSITLRSILDAHAVPKQFALLSIDIEGHEAEALETLDDYRPAVILVERSLQAIRKSFKKQQLLTSYEYIFAARIGCNEVYLDINSPFIQENLEGFEQISSIGI